MTETEELFLEKLMKWRNRMKVKGFRVNCGKTKVLWCQVNRITLERSEDSGKHPCGACRNGVCCNSIMFLECFG